MLGRYAYSLFLAILVAGYVSCSGGDSVSDSDVFSNLTGGWLIPQSEVHDGGPGKDGIPALINPEAVPASEATFMDGGELVVGVRVGNQVRAYPHSILDWHEIINDTIQGTSFAITYCPLTGTGIGWSRVLSGGATTFGVSGLLYNSNLILYDRATDSNWSQMQGRSINGEHIGEDIETVQVIETTWNTWKTLFPQTEVVSRSTGHNKPYGVYPYGNYRTSNDLIFPVSRNDTRLPRKERVHGIRVDDATKVYPIGSFGGAMSRSMIRSMGLKSWS